MGRGSGLGLVLLAVVSLATGCGGTAGRPPEQALPGLGDGCSRYDLLPVDGSWRDEPRAAAIDAVHGDANTAAPVFAAPTRVDADHLVVHASQDVLDWFVQLRSDGAGRWRATWVAQCWAPPSGNAEPDPAGG